MASLGADDRCLFEYGVFPAGGVGYADSSLPYDHYGALDRAFLTFRAELLREYTTSVLEVEPRQDDARTIIEVVVYAKMGWPDEVSEALKVGGVATTELTSALREITDSGVPIRIASESRYSLADSCEVREYILRGGFSSDVDVAPETAPTLATEIPSGQTVVKVPREGVESASSELEKFGDAVRVEGVDNAITLTARHNSYTPRRGGSGMQAATSSGICSNSFRINTTSISTAAHCGNGSWVSPIGGFAIGTSSSTHSLEPANVDINIVYGQSYANQVWVGTSAGSGLLTVQNFTDPALTAPGYNLLWAGAYYTPQTTLTVEQRWMCAVFPGVPHSWCELVRLGSTTSNSCIPGDSGGPIIDYRQSGPSISYASLTGAEPMNGYWKCFGTSMAAASFLYGGASIG